MKDDKALLKAGPGIPKHNDCLPLLLEACGSAYFCHYARDLTIAGVEERNSLPQVLVRITRDGHVSKI